MKFHTEYSVYEIDDDRPRIRRLSSTHPVTTHQYVPDGEWLDYFDLSEIQVGMMAVIIWSFDVKANVLKTTITSPVTEIEATT